MKTKLIFLILTLVCTKNYAQSWTKSNILIGDNDLTEISSVVDENKNIYSLGFFSGTVEGGEFDLTTIGLRDYFVSKITPQGQIEWLKQLGGSSIEYVGGGIAYENGYIYVTGGFRNDLYYTETDFISSSGGFDSFLIKYDISGNIIWCNNIGEGSANQRTENVELTSNGNLIINGFFTDSILIGSDTTLYSNDGFDDVFYSSFDLNGNHLWSRQIKYINGDNIFFYPALFSSLSTDTEFYFSGIYADSIILDQDTLVSRNHSYDILLFQTDLEGNVLWSRSIGGDATEYAYSMSKDLSGNLYVGGYYNSESVTVESGDGGSVLIEQNNGDYDFLLLKYSMEGELDWYKVNGGSSADRIYNVAFFDDNIHVSGYFSDVIQWGGVELSTTGPLDKDMFYGSLSQDGNYRSANGYSGRNGSTEEARAIFDDGENLLTVIRSNSDLLVLGDSIYTNPDQNYFIAIGSIGCLPISYDIITSTDITGCYGDETGSIFIGASGGFGSPYKYSIDDGLTYQTNNPNFADLPAGEYNLVVVDSKNCAEAGPIVTITEPDEIVITHVDSTDVLCNGETTGVINVAATGGTGSLVYSTDGGSSFPYSIESPVNVPEGCYSLMVKDANDCMVTGPEVTIEQPEALSILTVDQTDILCNGAATGDITIRARGGTKPYLFSIDGGTTTQADSVFSGLTADTYSIDVVDGNGCSISGSDVTLSQPEALVIDNVVTEDIVCFGDGDGTITVSASGGAPALEYSIDGINFQSSPAFTALGADTYSVDVRDANGCIVSQPDVIITQPDELVVNVLSTSNIFNDTPGEIVVEAAGGTAPYTYLLIPDEIEQDNGTFTFTEGSDAGIYNVQVDDANNCGPVTTSGIELFDSTSVSIDNELYSNFNVYPNPTRQQITIEFNTELDELVMEILSVDGKTSISKTIYSSSGKIHETINLDGFKHGVYILRLNHKIVTERILLE
jgi:hypothetical protein